jgi:hypothetical protein
MYISHLNCSIIWFKKVIPLQQTKTIPSQPPLNLSKCPYEQTIGRKSEALIELDDLFIEKDQQLRITAMKERDRLESNVLGKMQETS